MREEIAIKAENICKDFLVGENKVRIIKNVSFEIKTGEFVMIHGPSGCGKSTLLNIINGWEPPTEGKVFIFNEDLFQKSEDERAKLRHHLMAMMHQTPFWVSAFNVIENISVPHLLAGKTKKEAFWRANILLNFLGLSKYAHYSPLNLSIGQQQRVSLLRALINNPKILLADEPTGNLDTAASKLLMSLFKILNEQLKKTIIMVTHNLELLDYASKIISMRDGQIIKITTKEIKTLPKEIFFTDDLFHPEFLARIQKSGLMQGLGNLK